MVSKPALSTSSTLTSANFSPHNFGAVTKHVSEINICHPATEPQKRKTEVNRILKNHILASMYDDQRSRSYACHSNSVPNSNPAGVNNMQLPYAQNLSWSPSYSGSFPQTSSQSMSVQNCVDQNMRCSPANAAFGGLVDSPDSGAYSTSTYSDFDEAILDELLSIEEDILPSRPSTCSSDQTTTEMTTTCMEASTAASVTSILIGTPGDLLQKPQISSSLTDSTDAQLIKSLILGDKKDDTAQNPSVRSNGIENLRDCDDRHKLTTTPISAGHRELLLQEVTTSPSASSLFEQESSSYEKKKHHHRQPVREGIMRDRRKKDVHNMIERKRRYNINDKIRELGTLLPRSCVGEIKMNKGSILRASVDYLQIVNANHERVQEICKRHQLLENENKRMLQRIKQLESALRAYGHPVPASAAAEHSEDYSATSATIVKREPLDTVSGCGGPRPPSTTTGSASPLKRRRPSDDAQLVRDLLLGGVTACGEQPSRALVAVRRSTAAAAHTLTMKSAKPSSSSTPMVIGTTSRPSREHVTLSLPISGLVRDHRSSLSLASSTSVPTCRPSRNCEVSSDPLLISAAAFADDGDMGANAFATLAASITVGMRDIDVDGDDGSSTTTTCSSLLPRVDDFGGCWNDSPSSAAFLDTCRYDKVDFVAV